YVEGMRSHASLPLAACFGYLLNVRLPWPRVGRKESTMQGSVFHPRSRVFCFALCALLILALTLGILVAPRATAAPPRKVHCIGVLMFTSCPVAIEQLWQGLHELGYVEGRDLTLEVRSAEGKAERLADLAAELVHLPVDLIVAYTTGGVLAAKRATTTLPIIAAVTTDPAEAGGAGKPAPPPAGKTGPSPPPRGGARGAARADPRRL